MCGICGFSGIAADVDMRSTIDSMTASLGHRGPDGRRTFVDDRLRIAMGHTRLAIIDLDRGSQLMATSDGRYVIVFNGELYNFRQLRAELEREGCVFRMRSDTEVLLNCCVRWGVEALPRLEGMFAFALFDAREGSLLLARDRVGIKPLYYHPGPQSFVFGSEIKALFHVPNLPRRLDYESLADYLAFGYPLTPKTMFRDVRELPPGCWLRVSRQGVEQGHYWQWRREEEDWSEAEAIERVKETLVESLRSHIVSDVPIGTLLSGGIDSSLLVSLLVRELKVELTAFSVRFQDTAFDESPYARMVSARLGIPHREIQISSGAGSLDEVHRIMDQFDQPFADSSAIPTYLLSREIRKHVKVVIGGDGGDEMFGGYSRYHYADVARYWARCPSPLLALGDVLRRGGVVGAQFGTSVRLVTASSEGPRWSTTGRPLLLQLPFGISDRAVARRAADGRGIPAYASGQWRLSAILGRPADDRRHGARGPARRLPAQSGHDEFRTRAGGARAIFRRPRARLGGPPAASLEIPGNSWGKETAAPAIGSIRATGDFRATQKGVCDPLGHLLVQVIASGG